MCLQRQRFVGSQHFDQKREHVTEPGAGDRAELPFRVVGQRLQQRGFAVRVFQPRWITRVGAEPELGLRVGCRNGPPGEFGDGRPRSPCVRPYRSA
jgi:hypothetical protein